MKRKTLTVVIPVYNEEKRIHLAFNAIQKFKEPRNISIEKYIFVNDGSSDNTLQLLNNFKKVYKKSEVISYKKNMGRGYAVKQGMKNISTDYAIFLDADMSIPLSNLYKCRGLISKGVDVIVGSKKMERTVSLVEQSALRKFLGVGFSQLSKIILGVNISDFTAGFKLYSREVCVNVLPNVTQYRWSFDPESIFMANKFGYKVVEFPVTWKHVQSSSKVSVVRDAFRGIRDLYSIRTTTLSHSLNNEIDLVVE